ncbi:tyrosine-type recombinase/integrase [Mycolicibacter kumamotonensis]|uniref:Site-specific integrase n=1 Tax=Mycolicibacter kumamotonensis TaxID=354243 RepID=A0A7K3LGJ0_9MYCO|nr:site-specific integrase [Mycolicibacter kumamotonensis]NDJ91471.1 site-specific integrase [Mycolicibacter kumamotonensis]
MAAQRPQPQRTRRGFGQLRKRDSGRWTVNYTHNGQLWRAPATFPNKDSATAWLHDERKLIDLGTWTPPADRAKKATAKKLTLGEYATTWLAQRNITSRTRDLYEGHLRLHITPALGEYALAEITTEIVRQWHAELGTEHKTRNAHAYALLRTILNTAVDDGHIDKNPARIRGAAQVKHAERSVVLLEPGELAALADALPDALRLTVLLAGWCGLRRGETFALTRADIAADGSTVTVDKAVTYRNGKFEVGPPKTRESRRTVTVPTHLRPALVEHLAQHVGPAKAALLFPNPETGEHMTEWQFRTPFFAARAAIDKEGLHFHDLRHAAGVLSALAGATVKETMSRLGHTSAAMSMRYQHVAQGRADALAERLSALAGGAPGE